VPSIIADFPTEALPGAWPAALRPEELGTIDAPTPFLAMDLAAVRRRVARFRAALPGVQPFYAVKCNPDEHVLSAVRAAGANFEIASVGELRLLQALGVDPASVLYSNTVKPADHITEAARAGVWRFSFDSENELRKLARCAPGAAVYVRLSVDDSESVFPLSRKFGTDAEQAGSLLRLAERLGLQPYGITFHVGSQCTSLTSWEGAIASAGRLMAELEHDGIRLQMLDIGGGFPAQYAHGIPPIERIGEVVLRAIEAGLPYRPALLVAEPGRQLVAEAGVLVATVIGRARRGHEEWLHLDVGAYNGLMEAQQTGGRWPFPLWSSRDDHDLVEQIPYTVTGPTCDSSDTVFYGAFLPATLAEGDRLYIGSTGAYTLSYASGFNGFSAPTPVFIDA
jgi:ornithine decarboxylase